MAGVISFFESVSEVTSLITRNRRLNSLFQIEVQYPTIIATPRRKRQSKIAARISLSDDSSFGVEKEFEFKPSFDEYLKVMEFVKIDRENRANEVRFTKKKIGEEKEEGDAPRNISGKDSWKGQNTSLELNKTTNPKNKKLVAKKNGSSELKSLNSEKAAFKQLEKKDDLIGRPRVARVDMEERIQKLCKCLNGADVNIPEWKFSQLMRSAQIRFSDYSISRVIQILGELGNWRRVLQVIEWIQSRERFKSHKIRCIYTTAINALGRARRPVESLNLFREMLEQVATYPDAVAYRSVAVTLGQAGHMKELFDVIDTMQNPPQKKFKTGFLEKLNLQLEPDVIVYNAVLNACVQRKKLEGAFWVLQQISRQGEQPSITTYGLVMEVMLACEKYSLVYDFFKKLLKAYIPNALIYKVLINTLWREGKTDEAVTVVEDMERRGIVGNAALYYDLARCLCSAGRCHEGLTQVGKICRVANKPLVVTYTGLIQVCLESGNIQNAVYIFNHMQKFCSPNLITFNIIMKAFVDHDMFEEAKQLFLSLLKNGNLINGGGFHKVRVIPDIYSFNTMLESCLVRQKWDDLEFAYTQMLKYGHHFNEKRHLPLLLDAVHSGKEELLEVTWRHLAVTERVPHPLLVIEMFGKRLEQGDYAAALDCFNNACSESYLFSQKSWSRFFIDNGDRFEKSTLFKLFHETRILRARSQNPVLKHLVKACEDFLNTQNETNVELLVTVPLFD